MTWIPLNVHSQYSILDSTASVNAIAERAKAYQIPALALTDQGNLYGAVDFYKACKAAGVKPIFGCKIWMAPTSRFEKKRVYGMPNGFPILLLAKNNVGYRNLCKLSSLGFLEGFYYQPRIDKELLAKHKEGLICLTGPTTGPLGYQILQGTEEALLEEVRWYHDLFGEDLYLEIQRYPLNLEEMQEGWLQQRARDLDAAQRKVENRLRQLNLPLVATSEIHYLDKSDWQAHEVLLNIQSGETVVTWERDSMGNAKNRIPNPKRETAATHEYYFKTPEMMQQLFADFPQALEETVKIAEKCKCDLDFKTKHYPVFIPPTFESGDRAKVAIQYLRDTCIQGIETRYTAKHLSEVQKKYPGKDPKQVVRDRFEYEFGILTSKDMTDYMLIVSDFINWAKQRKIPMGPGRGSAAGSIIAYLTGITDIEPLRFHLFFERFINPERVSYPDIDVDICMNRRGEVIDYVVGKYGKDKVAQIITFGTMKAKMAIRDVGRVLNVPLAKVNSIAALVPEDPNMTLEKAFAIDPELKTLMDTDEEARQVLEMAKKTEGSIRNTSTHAAGLIISESAITDHIPVCTAKDSEMVVTQYAMKPVESVGMLKIDFLGLKTLTSLQVCADEIERNTGLKIDWSNLPLDDQKTFDLINQGKTLGVFQIETGGMADLARQLHIDFFEEIIAVVALFRPGPMDMIPSYISRKHGREAIEIDHPLMKDILSETYGVMVYQEQVMQIASALAGYSLGEGDVLRRAMGKKDKEEMAKQREKFISGSANNQIDAETSGRIFDKIEKFASYGFNKSHAAAYAYLSYATAFFKAHYPKEWMAALMTCDRDDTTKVAKLIGEARALGIPVLPPDIHEAGSHFAATPNGIRFAMSGIKGVGSNIVDTIIEERKSGKYQSLFDFIKRLEKIRIGKKQIELLIEAGCFDFTGWSRDAMLLSIPSMMEQASIAEKESSFGILSLFEQVQDFADPPQVSHPTPKTKLLQREKELLGFYLTGHPMDAFKQILRQLSCTPLCDFEKISDHSFVRAAFIIDAIQVKISTKSQKKFAILIISDGIEKFELPIWSEMFEEKIGLMKENQLLYAILQIERKATSLQLSCKYLEDLSLVDETKIKECDELFDKLKMQSKEPKWKKEKEKVAVVDNEETKHYSLSLDADRVPLSAILQLKSLLREHPGKSTLEIMFKSGQKKLGILSIDSQWGVKANIDFEKKLNAFKKNFESSTP
ncbi:MAG TPA: DNA polymerase III subunit alpha [Chlamydiales bacterium]|nr:DNA polymerase III subunit alpha [Chlamydiales bacterium]